MPDCFLRWCPSSLGRNILSALFLLFLLPSLLPDCPFSDIICLLRWLHWVFFSLRRKSKYLTMIASPHATWPHMTSLVLSSSPCSFLTHLFTVPWRYQAHSLCLFFLLSGRDFPLYPWSLFLIPSNLYSNVSFSVRQWPLPNFLSCFVSVCFLPITHHL